MLKATSLTWTKEVKESALPVVVDVSAAWCGPCRMMKPLIENVEKDLEGKVRFVSLDADEEAELTREMRVSSIPCLILFNGGLEKDRVVGFSAEAAIKKWVEAGLKG